MAYTPPKAPKPHNPFDTGATAHRQAGRTTEERMKGSNGKTPGAWSEADVHTGEVTDLEVGGYRSGALMAAAELIAKAMEVQPGEEGLEPQTA